MAYAAAEHDELLLRGRFVRDLAEAEWFLSEALAVYLQVMQDHRYAVLAATILPELMFPQKLLAAQHAVQQLSVATGEDLLDNYAQLFKAAERCCQKRNVLAHQVGGVIASAGGPISGHYSRWRHGNSATNSIDADNRELAQLDRVVSGLLWALMFDFIEICYPKQTGHPDLQDSDCRQQRSPLILDGAHARRHLPSLRVAACRQKAARATAESRSPAVLVHSRLVRYERQRPPGPAHILTVVDQVIGVGPEDGHSLRGPGATAFGSGVRGRLTE